MKYEFKYKLDFYYQQALIYVVTLIIYAGVKGTFIEDGFTVVLRDPIIYIITFFVVIAFGTLLLNRIRNKKLTVTDREIIFHHRFNSNAIKIGDIEWMHIGKDRGVQTAGRFQIVIIKLKNRRRTFRIRVGRYERDRELIKLMEEIAAHVPQRQRRFQFRRKK